jgi:predicted nucleic acid-binding protein
MTRFVVDAAALVRLLESGLELHPEHRLVAPAGIRSQALDILLGRVNRGELDEGDAVACHERMTELKIRALNDRVSRRTAWDIARAEGWSTVRLAEYIAVAKLQADALVADDDVLAEAARDHVPVEAFEALFSA